MGAVVKRVRCALWLCAFEAHVASLTTVTPYRAGARPQGGGRAGAQPRARRQRQGAYTAPEPSADHRQPVPPLDPAPLDHVLVVLEPVPEACHEEAGVR